jgi:hypothetical protein
MQRRTRKFITAILGAATLAAVGFAVHLSLNPNNYFFYRPEDLAKWVYDPGSVAFVCLLIFAEALLAWAALIASRPGRLWLRCLFALLLLVPWAAGSTMFVVHMPAYTLFHHLWVWSLVALMGISAAPSALRQLLGRLRKGPPNNSSKPTPLRGAA